MKLRGSNERALAAINGRARCSGAWLELSAPTNEIVTPAFTWAMLKRNASLDGAARLAVTAGAGTAHVRADVWIDEDADIDTRVATACDDMASLLHVLHAGSTTSDSTATVDTAIEVESRTRRLVDLCTEAGWPCTQGDAGVVVAIDAGGDVYQASLELTPDDRLRATVELIDAPVNASPARAAMALLLLTASAVVRRVKGVAVTRDGVDRLGVAVAGEHVASVADIDLSLSALTVACRAVGRELQALSHDGLARDYLAWRAPVPPDEPEDVLDEQPVTHAMEESTCLQQP